MTHGSQEELARYYEQIRAGQRAKARYVAEYGALDPLRILTPSERDAAATVIPMRYLREMGASA